MWAKWGQSKTKCRSSPNAAQSAAAEMPGDGRFSKPTLLHRQGMRPHAELHQQLYPGNGHWKLKVRHSFHLTGTQKPCKVCAELCPFSGSCSWGHMQTIPNPAELTLHVRLKSHQGVCRTTVVCSDDDHGETNCYGPAFIAMLMPRYMLLFAI